MGPVLLHHLPGNRPHVILDVAPAHCRHFTAPLPGEDEAPVHHPVRPRQLIRGVPHSDNLLISEDAVAFGGADRWSNSITRVGWHHIPVRCPVVHHPQIPQDVRGTMGLASGHDLIEDGYDVPLGDAGGTPLEKMAQARVGQIRLNVSP